jgi:BirA family biotin operon repressor/biotin-[acetyl-CoA-carboxylase] ligase
VADRQTAGQGRRGRPWSHATGNFAGTLLVPVPAETLAVPAAFSFLAGIAVCEALQPLMKNGGDGLALKWPNDVLLEGAKIGGILTELLERDGDYAISIGIGVNLVSAPRVEGRQIASAGIDAEGGRDLFFEAVDRRLQHWIGRYADEGFAPIREAWLGFAWGLGQPIRCETGGEVIDGSFAGLGGDGGLLVADARGEVRQILAGDVFFGSEPA